jgi:cytochrome c
MAAVQKLRRMWQATSVTLTRRTHPTSSLLWLISAVAGANACSKSTPSPTLEASTETTSSETASTSSAVPRTSSSDTSTTETTASSDTLGPPSSATPNTTTHAASSQATGTSETTDMGSVPTFAGDSSSTSSTRVPRLLVFSKTAAYRHESIAEGVAALEALATAREWGFAATEDAAQFTANLTDANVALFLSTTGDVLSVEQQTAFEQFIAAGNGYVGVHAASDTEYDWPWYGELVGAYFEAHPAIQSATIRVEDASHIATSHLPDPWTRTDEWYGFRENPRANVNVLLTLDESSYSPGDGAMGADHPIAWYHEYAGGRAFYTALGHTTDSYRDAAFMAHVEGAIRWASGSN